MTDKEGRGVQTSKYFAGVICELFLWVGGVVRVLSQFEPLVGHDSPAVPQGRTAPARDGRLLVHVREKPDASENVCCDLVQAIDTVGCGYSARCGRSLIRFGSPV